MASHNFIRNEVFDENVDRLNELTRFIITQRKTAEYFATIAEQEAERTRLRAVVPRDQAVIEVVEARIADVREEKQQFEAAAKAEIDRNLEKWQALGEKREENAVTSDFMLNIPKYSLEDWIAKLRADDVKPLVNVHFKEVKDCLYKNINAASYTEDEHEAGLAAKDVYFNGIQAYTRRQKT